MTEPESSAAELDRLVRRERGRLVADLAARLGPDKLDLAEDVAQDALIAAMATWPYRGTPDNPGAWLKTVARNKAWDTLRRRRREAALVDDPATQDDAVDGVFTATVEDPELRLILLCCHDALSETEQLTLTLKLVSGFTAREIGEALLASEAAIGQRIARTKRKLKTQGATLADAPSRFGIGERLQTTLKVVYLMFSLGYAPRSGDQLLRHDVIDESLRIARELAGNRLTGQPDAHALAALLCFQSSRLAAREDADGRIVLLADQDRSLWDRALIDEGLAYLKASQQARVLSRYHLEAGIASLYATAPSWEDCDWASIRRLYTQLAASTDSPVISINASVARAMSGEPAEALNELETLAASRTVRNYAPYHLALAEAHRLLGDDRAARDCYAQALSAGVAAPVQTLIEERLSSCL